MIINMIIKYNKNLHDIIKETLHKLFLIIFNNYYNFSFLIKIDNIFVIYKNCKLH